MSVGVYVQCCCVSTGRCPIVQCMAEYGADGCVKNPLLGKKNCLKDVKEYLKTNEKCFLFAKQRIIVWNGNKIRIPRKATSEEIDEVLKYNNFLD